MAARQYYYVSATAEATATTTTGITTATLSFTPDDNASYALFWSGLMRQATGLTIDGQILLTNNSTATLARFNIEPQDVTTYQAFGGMAFATFATATGVHNFRIKLLSETATGIQNMKDAFLLALRLATTDFFTQTSATVTNAATTWATAATLSFTPSATGDYLVIGSAEWSLDNAAIAHACKMAINGTGTDYGTATNSVQDITNFKPWATAAKKSQTATEMQITLQHREGSADDHTVRQRRLLALRLDQFENSFYAENRAVTLVTATTASGYATSASLAFAPVATGMHLAIYGGFTAPLSNAIDGVTKITGTNLASLIANEEANLANDELVFWGIQRWDATSTATRTWMIQHGLESTTTGGAFRRKEAFIACLQLDAGVTATATATATGAFQGTYTKMMMGVGLGMGSLAVLPAYNPFGKRRVA